MKKGITKRKDDYAQWYLDVIAEADLAEHAPVKGCMIIKPYGYAIWENIQRVLDAAIKATGVKNAYFPLFIPKSFLEREKKHVKGFAPEFITVTHAGGKKLDEPLIIRPTSETVIYEVFSKWIKSYRDLPLLINQWANIARWELRPRLFLRTIEFLWQEGHTVHSTEEEAEAKAREMLEIYTSFAENYLALPVIPGVKTETEKFPGAVRTYCVESMMQDGKALQAGTSHMLGQNFAKVFNVKFLGEDGVEHYGWQTSWGVSTRLIGALIMAHSDDKGLVLPPQIAPIQVVIIPVWVGEEEREKVFAKAVLIAQNLQEAHGINIEIDKRETMRPGAKFFEWEKKGVPIRIEIGPKDIAKKSVIVVRRDTSEKESVIEGKIISRVGKTLNEIQDSLFSKALTFQRDNSYIIDSWDEFKAIIGKGGFVYAHWCENADCEAKVKEETKATIRNIPLNQREEKGKCIFCDKPSNGHVIFAKAY
ncbi:MAG: proline--tRNA ligase [bacterium]